MIRSRFVFLFITAAALIGGGAVHADTLRSVDLPPKAELVIHVDLDACRQNELMAQMTADLLATEYLKKQIASIPADLMPLVRQIPGSVTVVMQPEDELGLVVFSQANADAMIGAISQAPSYAKLSFRGMGVHHWKADLKQIASHFNQSSEIANSDKEESEIVPYYVAVSGDGYLAVSNDLRMLVAWIDRVTGNVASMSNEEFSERFHSESNAPVLTINLSPVKESTSSDSDIPFQLKRAFIWADEKIHAHAEVDLKNEAMAMMIAQIAQPKSLARHVVQMAVQARDQAAARKDAAEQSAEDVSNPYQGEDDDSSESTENEDGSPSDQGDHKNTLQFGVGFRGMNLQQDEEPNETEVESFFRETMSVSRSGKTLTLNWSGYARLTYEHRAENGRNHHNFQAWLGEHPEDAARLAERQNSGTDRR